MKRRLVRLWLAILIIVGILLGLLVVLIWEWRSEMSFEFLEGRALTANINRDSGRYAYRTIWHVYSFEGDFNDICAIADAELLARGFKIDHKASLASSVRRDYCLGNETSNKAIVVSIRGRQEVKVHPTTEPSQHSNQDRILFHHRRGWISVHITRKKRRLWPPRYFLHHLRSRFRRIVYKQPTPIIIINPPRNQD